MRNRINNHKFYAFHLTKRHFVVSNLSQFNIFEFLSNEKNCYQMVQNECKLMQITHLNHTVESILLPTSSVAKKLKKCQRMTFFCKALHICFSILEDSPMLLCKTILKLRWIFGFVHLIFLKDSFGQKNEKQKRSNQCVLVFENKKKSFSPNSRRFPQKNSLWNHTKVVSSVLARRRRENFHVLEFRFGCFF